MMLLGGKLLGDRAITASALILHNAANPPHDQAKLLGSSAVQRALSLRQ